MFPSLSQIEEQINGFQSRLDPASFQFLQRVFQGGLSRYEQRLRQCGFLALERVLDAGCGFGQWSVALASLNQHVVATGANDDRKAFLDKLIIESNIGNLEVGGGDLQSLPFDDESLDGIFCYQVLPATPWREVLVEFHRVLKPNSPIYVNAYGFGHFQHLWKHEPNKSENYDPKEVVAMGLVNTWRYERDLKTEGLLNMLIEPEDLESQLCKLGFINIRTGSDGELVGEKCTDEGAPSFFPGFYGKERGVYETMAQKGPNIK